MPLLPNSPCHERWSTLTPNGDGRYCQKCDKSVVDLTRLTRRQAEKLVVAAGGALCGRVRVDPSGTPVFRPDPARAPGLFGVATASLLAACGSTTEAESASTPATLASIEERAPEVTTGGDHLLETGAPTGSLAAPMMPLADDRDVAAASPAAPPSASVVGAVVEDEGDVVPTADQLTLTAEKEEDRRPARRRRRSGAAVTASDPAPATTTGGRRNNGAHGSVAPLAAAPSPAVNTPPPTMYLGGISYVP